MTIEVVDYSDELFSAFQFFDAPYGYDVITESGGHFGVFPNQLSIPGERCFVVNERGNGVFASYLGAHAQEGEAMLLLGLTDPLRVFVAPKKELIALHRATAGNDQTDTLDPAFIEHDLINEIAAFSHGQSWRPWQEHTH